MARREPAINRVVNASRTTVLLALGTVAGPCLALAWLGGGTGIAAQTAVYGGVCAALAVWSAVRWRAGEGMRVPRGALLWLGWPLLQLVPLPVAWLARVAPERAGEGAAFARQGIEAATTVSLYPYATARAVLGLAGAVALFLLARETGRRERRAVLWVAAALLAGLAAEAALGVGQYLRAQAGLGAEWDPTALPARGTFGNRNLLAAWLEGGCGLALGVAAGWWQRGRRGLVLAAAGAGLAGALGIVVTFSRMGQIALAALVLLFAATAWRRRESSWRPAVAAALAVMGAVAMVGWPALAQRYRASALAVEREGRVAMWRDAAAAARRYGLAGAGAGAFPWAFRRSRPYLVEYTIDHPHQDALETAVEWGWPAALLLVVAGAVALGGLVARLRRAPDGWCETGLGCVAGAVAILVHGLADFPLRIPGILALWTVLLGLAAACAARDDAGRVRRRGRASAALVAAVAAGFAAVTVWSWPGSAERLERSNAEVYYRQARTLVEAGRPDEAERACQEGLRRNPYAAPLWDEAALLAEARGAPETAVAWSETALGLEPHARRTLWTAGNLKLRQGDAKGAALLLAEVAAHAPLWRGSAAEVWWQAGLPPELLLQPLVALAPAAVESYLRDALARQRWDAVEAAARAGLARGLVSQAALRDAGAGLFAAGRGVELEELWRSAGGESGFVNGDLETDLRGWGLDWVLWEVEGVQARRVRDGEGFRIEVDFTRPQNLAYAGVTHDFVVAPGREYRLRLETASEGLASASGVQVEVLSTRATLAVSEPLLRTNPWKTIELRFRPGPGEGVCRLRVVRRATTRFDNRIGGRFSLRRVRLDAAS